MPDPLVPGAVMRSLASVLTASLLLVASACGSGDDGTATPRDAGASGFPSSDAASGGRSAAGGAGGAASTGGGGGSGGAGFPPVVCGETTCEPPDRSTGLQAFACCTAETQCGLRLPISQKCLQFRQPGHLDPLCPTYQQQQLTLRGCCAPQGCGAWATFSNVGCIPNADLGLPTAACNYDTLSTDGGDVGPADAATGD